MNFEQITNIVDTLNDRATETADANAALKWTQAATNAANSYATLKTIQRG